VVEVDLDLDPAAEVTAAFDRLCVSVVNKPPPAAAVGKDSASSTLVNSVAFGKDSSSSARSPPTMSTEQPHSWSTPAVTTPLSAASTVPVTKALLLQGLNRVWWHELNLVLKWLLFFFCFAVCQVQRGL
jgi:hypothetical protein